MVNRPLSFTLARALRDIDRFKPLTQQEEDELTALLHAWMDRARVMRGDVVENLLNGRALDLKDFALKGEIGPPREAKDTILEL